MVTWERKPKSQRRKEKRHIQRVTRHCYLFLLCVKVLLPKIGGVENKPLFMSP